MKDIKKSLYLYSGTFTLLIIASLSFLIAGADHLNRLWLFLPLSVSTLAAVFIFLEYSRLKTSKLIIENQILHICPAVIEGRDAMGSSVESMEVFVSCFGILLGSNIIKFNQEGIRLKSVEIGRHYLSIDYGTDVDIQSIRLLYARPDCATIAGIIEKFRYETGVVPCVTQ